MRRICRFLAPIETSTAMSRVFSITIMISEIKNIQRGNEDNQSDGDERHHPLQPQGVKDCAVLLHPVGRHETLAGSGLQLLSDLRRVVDIVDLEFQHRHNIAQVEQLLRVGERDEGPGTVVLIETRREDSRDFKSLVLGNNAEGRQLALVDW